MSRVLFAAAMALAPVLALLVLLARARQSWQSCITDVAAAFGPAFNTELSAALHPISLIAIAPFLALALIWALLPSRRKTLAVWAVYAALILLPLLSPALLHDCDRKGPKTESVYILLPLLGLIACWVALWRNERPV